MHQRDFPSSHSSIVAAVEDEALIPAPGDREVRSAITFLRNKRRGMLNAGVILLHDNARWSTHLLQEFSWEVFNHPLYSPDLVPSDFHSFLHLKKFLSGQRQRFQNDSEAEMSTTQRFQSQAVDFCDRQVQSWSQDMINDSIPEVNMLKTISTLAVSVRKILFIKQGFVPVNCPRESYFEDALKYNLINVSRRFTPSWKARVASRLVEV